MSLRKRLNSIFEAITGFLMLLMVAVTLAQVINRYAVYAIFDWTEELARIDVIYLTFFGSVVAFQRHEHLVIETLVRMLPPLASRWMRILVDLLCVIVLGIIAWAGIPLLWRLWNVRTAALGWPTPVVYFPAIFGCLVLMIYTAGDVCEAVRGEGSDREASS